MSDWPADQLEDGNAPRKPAGLTAAERRAVLPDDGAYAGGPALDVPALLAGLDGLPVPLATTRLQLSAVFGFLARTAGERLMLSSVCWVLLLVPLLVFNARLGAFGAKQAAIGATAIAAHNVACIVLGALSIWTAVNYARTVPSLDTNPFATLVRWRRLLAPDRDKVPSEVADGEPTKEREISPLVRHDPEDRLCPCPFPGCAGSVLTSTWILYLLDPAVQSIIMLSAFALSMWTLLATFAPVTCRPRRCRRREAPPAARPTSAREAFSKYFRHPCCPPPTCPVVVLVGAVVVLVGPRPRARSPGCDRSRAEHSSIPRLPRDRTMAPPLV
ncbi:hypothetical protein DFJ74DRAFT_400316 [Hyaloraphidium curvatum]|nr:hypothetical protein DFJ74DRAFT_400316 [Hyaloraphidium curvatum]